MKLPARPPLPKSRASKNRLPGSAILVTAQPCLTAYRGKLLSGQAERGTPVHAASFIRRREIVLETELLDKPELPLILVHEIFHFVWARLGNSKRDEFRELVGFELRSRARGELGESSAVKKAQWRRSPTAANRRDYICESFCDTGAWMYAGVVKHADFTLARRWSDRRRAWMASAKIRV